MNRTLVSYFLGQVTRIVGFLMLLPCIVSLVYREHEGGVFFGVAAACILLGTLLSLKKPASNVFYLKEGCILTAASWLLISFLGALPFFLTREIPFFLDALFETISGFTTTGSSILTDVEALSHTALFWRSFTHWIGGMGVLVFLLAVLPMSGGSSINLMRAESPGPDVDKIVPKIRSSAMTLYLIYLAITVAEIVVLLLSGMPLFDSLTLSFGTAGTGGFAIRNTSIGGYSALQQWIITIFMALFGINFNFYYLLLIGNARRAFRMEEVRAYFLVILGAVAVITANIASAAGSVFTALREAAFQVSSIITTTGFGTADFDTWPTLSKMILVSLMFIGACAGSTGGGIKVSRFLVMARTVRKEIRNYVHPRGIWRVQLDGHALAHETLRSINVYMFTFLILFVSDVFLICLIENCDLVTAFTSVAATINNIGPGLAMVGPTQNFGWMHPLSKIVLSFAMLAGRLELFPMILFFHPGIWRDMIRTSRAWKHGSPAAGKK